MRIHACVLLASLMGAVSVVHAGFVDERTSPGTAEFDAVYKQVSVDDVVSGLVPPAYTVQYQDPAMRSAKTSVVGRGAWNVLLDKGLAGVGLKTMIDTNARIVKVVAANSVPAGGNGGGASPASAAGRAPEAKGVTVHQVLPTAGPTYRTEVTDGTISRTVARWAALSNMQMEWDPVDVDYAVRGDNTFGTDLRKSLTDLFASLKGAPTELRTCIHPNKPRNVIRVIRAGESCLGN